MEIKTTMPSEQSGFLYNLQLWGPPFLLSVGIFILSSIPGNRFPDHPQILNFIVHFLEFFLLGFFLARAFFSMDRRTSWRIMALVLLISGGFGLLDELYQFSVPLRVFDPMDILNDLAGALAGGLLFLGMKNRRKAKGGAAGR